MRQALRRYSHLLQLRPQAVHDYLSEYDAAQALKLLVVVGLIAGLGVWLGVPSALRQLTLPEQVDQAVAAARATAEQVGAAVLPVILESKSAVETFVTLVQEQVAAVVARADSFVSGISAAFGARREQVTQNTQMQQVQELLGQATVSAGEVEQLLNQGPITVDQLSLLLSRGNFTPQQSRRLLALAGLTDAQLAQVQSRLQGQGGAAVDAAMIQLQPFLDQLSLSEAQLTRILAQLGTTPAQFNDVLQQLSILPAAAGALMKRIEATPAQLEQLASDIRAEAVKAEPRLGTRPSRVIRLAGDWVSVPLRLAGDWLYFALVLLLVTKLLGGRAPLPKHLGAMALAAAPLVLLVGLYSPDLNGVLTLTMAGAVHYYARVLALIGLVWGSLLLLRTLSLAHEISLARTAVALTLTWVAIYVLIPLAGVLITGYLVTG